MAMSSADRVVVPLNSRCSRKWLEPARLGVSSREPTPTQTPTLALRTPGIASVTMRRPPGSTVRVITPPPVAASWARARTSRSHQPILKAVSVALGAAQGRTREQHEAGVAGPVAEDGDRPGDGVVDRPGVRPR